MTKGEIRKARKEAANKGLSWKRVVQEPKDQLDEKDRGESPVEFSETAKGYRARERWAKRYDSLNGAPEGDWDR